MAPAKEQPIERPDEAHGGVFVPDGASEVERQAEVVRVAMAQGGRFGEREIPVPWLRRILAGRESLPHHARSPSKNPPRTRNSSLVQDRWNRPPRRQLPTGGWAKILRPIRIS
jgi:hypothetical protein